MEMDAPARSWGEISTTPKEWVSVCVHRFIIYPIVLVTSTHLYQVLHVVCVVSVEPFHRIELRFPKSKSVSHLTSNMHTVVIREISVIPEIIMFWDRTGFLAQTNLNSVQIIFTAVYENQPRWRTLSMSSLTHKTSDILALVVNPIIPQRTCSMLVAHTSLHLYRGVVIWLFYTDTISTFQNILTCWEIWRETHYVHTCCILWADSEQQRSNFTSNASTE